MTTSVKALVNDEQLEEARSISSKIIGHEIPLDDWLKDNEQGCFEHTETVAQVVEGYLFWKKQEVQRSFIEVFGTAIAA